MILNICSNIGFFNLIHSNIVYLLCFFVLVFAAFVFIKFKFVKFDFVKENFVKHQYFIFAFILILCIGTSCVFYLTINEKKYYGCTCKEIQNNLLVANAHLFESKLEKANSEQRKNKIIVIGDSRFEYIVNKKDVINIPRNFIIIAKSGANHDWFHDTSLGKLYDILDKRNKEYEYHVVMNVGVNDIQYNINYQPDIDKYIEDYNNLALKYPSVDFYILSINPINEDKLNDAQPQNIRTNKKIEDFNDQLLNDVLDVNMKNLNYCDSYHDIYFRTNDGLHYTDETGQETLDYIKEKCVK